MVDLQAAIVFEGAPQIVFEFKPFERCLDFLLPLKQQRSFLPLFLATYIAVSAFRNSTVASFPSLGRN